MAGHLPSAPPKEFVQSSGPPQLDTPLLHHPYPLASSLPHIHHAYQVRFDARIVQLSSPGLTDSPVTSSSCPARAKWCVSWPTLFPFSKIKPAQTSNIFFSLQRLAKWFTTLSPKEKAKIIKDVTQLVLSRRTRMCNFLEYKGLSFTARPYYPTSSH